MSHKIIKPDLDLVLRDFLFLAWWQLYIQRSRKWLPVMVLWLVLLWGVFSIFEAAIKADEVAVEAEATQIRIGKLKWLVNHQHKIITQHDQSLERMLEFKSRLKTTF